ncbi:zinc ABC transporter substrate-binding protein [Amphibacillus sp. MSJ-3]|uniref:metal ABC transporter solute-binding protein, Zn/Mn family n=1 Tax=Amphibacillus sp. MSJ-3 TaxID=2841505 RepID=UPI001C0EC04B|nr:zinc ABC transporter substrate-binding protein [Amphibacillus sp. MSJ-3]MBU5595357.1 zinc ABC transporter substrate-binding protein [Amphibacillus sp. MSJ-3]
MKLFLRLILTSFVALFFVACGQQEGQLNRNEAESNESDQLVIYTTLYPLEFLANEIGGDKVSVHSILPAGADAHSFEPTSRMMVEIADADLFIYNDGSSESYATTIKEAVENETVEFLEASEGLDKLSYYHDHDNEDENTSHHDDHGHGNDEMHHNQDGESQHHHEDEMHDDHAHSHGDFDPHVWLSPVLMDDLAGNILTKLIELMPEEQEYFNNNFDLVSNRLVDLDQHFTNVVNQFNQKTILVTHAAYGYWERDYGLKQLAITGLSASEEPSQRQLANLIEQIKDSEIEYLLFDQNIQPRVATVIQEEAGLTSLEIHNLEVLTEEDIEAGENYFSLMEHNIDVLQEALK